MFLFIVYGVGPRHCQNVGCSKSTAKAQLWDTPSVKLTDVKVGNPVHLLPCCHLPLSPWLWAPVALPLAQRSPAVAPSPRNASHLPHTHLTSRRGAEQCSSVPWEQSAQDLPGTSCSSKKMGQNIILTKLPPWLLPEPEDFPPAAIFTMHQQELAADSIKKHNKT